MCNLLIVDDQAGVRRLLYEFFNEEGYEVDMAASGEEAIKKVLLKKPGLILLDNKMPAMNGIQTAYEIRKYNKDVPIILMTAEEELGVMLQAKKLGIEHCLNKPFDLDEAGSLVKALFFKEPVLD